MANASNAYATINPIRTNIGDVVQGIEKMDFAYREEQRQVDAINQKAEEAKQKKQKQLIEAYKTSTPESTGIGSVDQAYLTLGKLAIEELLPIFKKESAGLELTNEEILKRDNILAFPEKAKLMSKYWENMNAEYTAHIKSGGHRDLEYEKKIMSMPTNAKAFFDKQGNPTIGIDSNNDGEIDFISSDLSELSIKPNFVKKINLETAIKEAAANLETTREVTDRNFRKETNESLPIDIAKSKAKTMIYNEDGSLSDLAISQFYPLTIDKIDKKDLIDFENKLTNALVNSKKKIEEVDVDYNAQTGRMSEKRQAKKEKEEKQIQTTTVNLNNTGFGNDSFGTVISKKGILEKGLNLGDGIKFDTIGGAKTGLDNSVITNIFINDKNQIIFTANVLTQKSGKQEQEDFTASGSTTTPASYRSETRIATGATEAKIASELGYKNADELKAELKKLNNTGGFDWSKQ